MSCVHNEIVMHSYVKESDRETIHSETYEKNHRAKAKVISRCPARWLVRVRTYRYRSRDRTRMCNAEPLRETRNKSDCKITHLCIPSSAYRVLRHFLLSFVLPHSNLIESTEVWHYFRCTTSQFHDCPIEISTCAVACDRLIKKRSRKRHIKIFHVLFPSVH